MVESLSFPIMMKLKIISIFENMNCNLEMSQRVSALSEVSAFIVELNAIEINAIEIRAGFSYSVFSSYAVTLLHC